jgi:murein DD-endopeptidase MepM/ murein hydrolase activator NlpD
MTCPGAKGTFKQSPLKNPNKMHYYKTQLSVLFTVILLILTGCETSNFDSQEMKDHAKNLKESNVFRYPLDDFFPEIPVTSTKPPKGEKYHTAEDCFVPPGTPVYAIGDGKISYSGRAKGYGWLVIIDHPDENVYSLYGHLSTSRWKKKSGEVKKGELIAYIGEAEEGETTLSHIHFGLRMGQRNDYPRWGNQRWMAGYTTCPPRQVGWFNPSGIIGVTDSMKVWHRHIQKREDIVTGRALHAGDFRITAGKYGIKDDLDNVIKKEFGDSYRLADWSEIKTLEENPDKWADDLGFKKGEKNSLLVSNDGYKVWLGRQYYISRFNHHKPKGYLAHDEIDDDLVCLGSWHELNMHVLAVKK